MSAEVYDELYRAQIAEKKVRRGLARTMGAIVLDAIEAHASRLATTWTDQQYAVGRGKSLNALPRKLLARPGMPRLRARWCCRE